jgi:putative methionine-R-sulfoxide reductase with GAF domain
MSRDYQAVIEAARTTPAEPIELRMQRVVDALWDAFHNDGVSWVGFYLADERKPEGERLILGPCRDKPACSPIGIHGACGAAYMLHASQIVEDVRSLGPNYIACDPRDRSEIVVPVLDENGEPWGVLDLDSFDAGAFDHEDDEGLRKVLEAAGFRCPPRPKRAVSPTPKAVTEQQVKASRKKPATTA